MKKLKILSAFLLVVAYVSFVSAGFMNSIVDGLSVLGAVSLTYGLIGGIYSILSDGK